MFWKVIKKLLFSESPIVIVGSPGVGKSCFLMLLAFYLACIEKRKVLVIRRLTGPKHANAVVLFDGQGSYAGLFDLSSRDIAATRDQARGAIVLVDGFDQEEVQAPANSLAPFHLLATSCQYDVKQSDPSSTVVLPAWRFDDLLTYAKLTNWVIDTGLRETKELKDSTWSKLVEEQYFYSGGSLGEFCEERKLLKTRVGNHSCAVVNSQEFELMDSYIGWKEESPEDRLRRHYIADIHEEEHYSYCVFWKLAVDSGYVLRKLGRSVDTNKLLEICKYAKSIDAGFHGVAYELLLHNVVHAASGKRKPIVLKMREGSEYEKIEILVRKVVSRGEDEASYYAYLSTLGKYTYWYPDYPFFPFIGAVTTCKAFRSGSTDSETILAYIQVTIQSEEKFKEKRLHQLNELIDTNPLLKGMKRAFVIVSPDSNVCERFILRRAPETKMFPTMVSCFNPEQQET